MTTHRARKLAGRARVHNHGTVCLEPCNGVLALHHHLLEAPRGDVCLGPLGMPVLEHTGNLVSVPNAPEPFNCLVVLAMLGDEKHARRR